MANRIKGITIDIDGNTTKLTDSLKSVDKSLKDTQAKLKDVDKLLKFDPKNTDLLKQKQELLAKAVSDTKTRLDELKKAQQQMIDSGVDKNSEQYQALVREIAETEQQLKNAEGAARNFGSVFGQQLQAAGSMLQELGGKVADFGESLTKNVTGPIVAVAGATGAAWNKVDDGMDIIIKKTGATGDELNSMKDIAKDIGATMPVSFDKIGEAIGEVNTRFGVTGDDLQDLSEQFLKFAEINDTNITTSVDRVQKAMSAYGVSIEDTSDFLDTLTVVSQQTGVSVDTLENGLIQNATAFQEMGLSVEQAVMFMGQMEKSGANSETVMNGLRKALKNATADGKDMNTALFELQDAILNGTDSMDGLTLAYDLFGKSGDQIYSAIQNGTLDFTNLADASLETGDAVASTFEEMTDPADQWQTVLNTLMTLGYDIAEAVMPAIQTAVETIIPIIQGLIDAWNSLDEDTQAFILTAVAVVAAIGPIITIVGNVISIIGTAMTVLGGVVSFLGGPLTLAIAAVIAIGVLLYQNWETIKQKAGELWNTISEKFNAIKTTISDTVSGAWKTVSEKFESIRSTIGEKIEGAKQKVSDAIQAIKNLFHCKISWPHLPLPHFSVSGSANPLDWLKQGVPKISVSWYAKAMDNGMILTEPTIFGMQNGRLLGAGEAGPEVVVGASSLYSMIQNAAGGRTVNAPINLSVTVNGNIDNSDRFAKKLAGDLASLITRESEVFR